KLIFLPPYSPDYNPIEMAYSTVKSHLRRHSENGENTSLVRISEACCTVTPEKAAGFYRAAGYI
ncbi:hypothetical protein OH77DRAFT_1413691, partial [Trametes cingulata]